MAFEDYEITIDKALQLARQRYSLKKEYSALMEKLNDIDKKIKCVQKFSFEDKGDFCKRSSSKVGDDLEKFKDFFENKLHNFVKAGLTDDEIYEYAKKVNIDKDSIFAYYPPHFDPMDEMEFFG